MNIWLIYSLYPPYTGGCATYSNILVHQLPKLDSLDHVFLLTEHLPGEWVERGPGYTVYRILPRRGSLTKKILLRNVAAFLFTQIVVLCFFVYVGLFRRGDIVQLHSRLSYRWWGWLLRLLGLKSVVDVRDLFFKPENLRNYRKIICASLAIQDRVRDQVRSDAVYVPVPLDLDEIAPRKESDAGECARDIPDGEYILFVGAISEGKGIPELIEGFQRYRKSHDASLHLVLAGRNLMGGKLYRRNLENVLVMGEVPRKDVCSLMKRSRLVILPSRAEGMPRVCLEAMLLGVPFIYPAGIRELDDSCPGNALESVSAVEIAGMLAKPVDELRCTGYPLQRHGTEYLLDRMNDVYHELAR